ncbi:FecR family protein [Aquimarina sediminis]|uniref:FecR family protein n=1 Tax=Aquimarina sediminis TaxID=2070536 RepID=UPI000CA04E0D|nr:FecR family protein [Aquimarina sediminis]
MSKTDKNKIISDFLKDEISSKDEKIVDIFLDSYQKDTSWEEWKPSDEDDYNPSEFDKLKNQIKSQEQTPIKKNNTNVWYRYAAIFVVLIGVGMFFYLINPINVKGDFEKVTLLSEDGNSKTFEETTILDLTKEQDPFAMGDTKKSINKYITLHVPRGKKYKVILSDGTGVYVNADSELRFLNNFQNSQERQVFLSGEAYFEVVKDSFKPFVVAANDLNVKVYGTKFNVSAYENERNEGISLLSGKVGVFMKGKHANNKEIMLIPDEVAIYTKIDDKITISKANAKRSIGWTQGILYIDDERFDDLINELERSFNVTITNNYSNLSEEKFTGEFEMKEGLEYILTVFSENYPFDFSIKNNEVVINPVLN